MRQASLLIALTLLVSSQASADALDRASQEALLKSQQQMRNRASGSTTGSVQAPAQYKTYQNNAAPAVQTQAPYVYQAPTASNPTAQAPAPAQQKAAANVQSLESGGSGSLDKASQEAMEKTQTLLRDRGQRDNAMKENKDAQQNHQALKELMGGSQTNVDAVYGMSADIFQSLVKGTDGDPMKMQQKLIEAQKNPEAFLRSLSPAQRQQIEALAKSVERGPSQSP